MEIHAGLCKTSLVTAASPYQCWNVMNGLYVASHTQQLSVCLKIFLPNSVHFQYLCKLCITEKLSWKFYKKYPVSKVLLDTKKWKNFEQEVQCWSEIKYKNAKTDIPFTYKDKRYLIPYFHKQFNTFLYWHFKFKLREEKSMCGNFHVLRKQICCK